MPATTEGVPLMAVTTVRTVLTPPLDLVQVDSGGDGEGDADQHSHEHLLKRADDRMDHAHLIEGVGISHYEALLVLGEERAPVD